MGCTYDAQKQDQDHKSMQAKQVKSVHGKHAMISKKISKKVQVKCTEDQRCTKGH